MKNSAVLLRTLLLSTSSLNILRYTKDDKKRKRIIGNIIGLLILYAMLMGYSIAMCVGYGKYGIIGAAPVMCALLISALAFFFTIFKTNGYLFNFREYDLLMSLPFEAGTVAACKFAYMYLKSLPWYLSISLAMLIGYGLFAHPAVYVYPLWLVLTLFLPLLPMLIAAFLGFLVARISTGFRRTNLLQTILTFLFAIFCFALRFILEDIFRNDKVQSTLEKTSALTDSIAGVYRPAGWFAAAVTRGSLPGILLLVGGSALLFAVVFSIVGRSYLNINSALKSHAASGSYRMTAQKKRSVVRAIAFKEFRRLTGSTTYMVNGCLGLVLAVLFGLIALIFGMDKIIAVVTQGAPVDSVMLRPAIPFIVYFFVGMMSTTACTPSLEGKNYWILQSLPIEKKTIYQGKMLFNMLLAVPCMVFSTLCLCISARVPVPDTLLYLLLGLALCAFSTAWGCVCGVRHMRLDWENEIEVIKQGTAVALYMLPNLFVVMALVVGVVILGLHMDHRLLAILLTLLAAALAALSYRRVLRLARENR